MANGAAVRLPLPSEPTFIDVAADQPEASASTPAGVEAQIGTILCEITTVSQRAVADILAEGRATAASRGRGGELIVELLTFQQSLGEANFTAAMHRQGQLRLSHLNKAAIDDIVGMVIGVVSEVAIVARAWSH